VKSTDISKEVLITRHLIFHPQLTIYNIALWNEERCEGTVERLQRSTRIIHMIRLHYTLFSKNKMFYGTKSILMLEKVREKPRLRTN
jgi:hypothetical protein